ncbi:hypothetical protein BDQ17DRAFT_1273776 [Cyathus striatus]|nr:hypothetical protein BDQ17DRAFT_1273776 [Cyathus striatus]
MSSLAFLVTELQSLASETRRKQPEIREAAEKSIAILRASPEQDVANLAVDDAQSEEVLKPVFMGCATKNAKVVAISLGSLQRLISLKAVPQSAAPLIISTMSDAMSQGVDIQLRILQTLVSLVPNFSAVHGDLLGDALLLCFKLQESRIAVVSSTAAATLRQLVMFVVDKMVAEDRMVDEPNDLIEVTLPDGTIKQLGPSAKDAFSVFEDLCLLANAEKPHFLKLEFLHKTFALELIESVLTNYHELFRQHPELVLLLRHHLCPLLHKALSDRSQFPLMLRCTRVVFLLLKQFSNELRTEAEVFTTLLIRLVTDEDGSGNDQGHGGYGAQRPLWIRVLAMEVVRGLCSDAELMRHTYDRYDSMPESGSNVFGSLVAALNRLVTEKPVLLGTYAQMNGLGVEEAAAGVGAMAGRVAGAAVSGVVGMMGAGSGSTGAPGLSLAGSSMKLQCIDQLDKAEAPPIPEPYIYLLAVQSLVSLCDGLFAFAMPLYTTIIRRPPPSSSSGPSSPPPVRAPPALDLSTLPQDEPSTKHLQIVRSIIETGWPALLAALSFVLATNLSDELFVDVLGAYQGLINTSGILGLATTRDALFFGLSKFAVPTRVVSSLDSYMPHLEPPPTPRSVSVSALSADFGLGIGEKQMPGLSERNMSCLKVFLASALFLAGSLGRSWFQVLEVLQNADYVLTGKGMGVQQSASARRVTSPATSTGTSARSGQTQATTGFSQGAVQRHPLLTDLDPEIMQASIQRLFDASKNLEDSAFKDFVDALCKLSSEMVGMQAGIDVSADESVEDVPLSPKARRRVSGIHIPRTLRSGDFGISKLGHVTMINIHRLIYRTPDVAWDTTTTHLLSIIRLPVAPQSIRVQAARVLDELLLVVPRNLSTAGDLQVEVQRRVLDVLARQVIPDPAAHQSSASVELRKMGLETLHQILQASGHTLLVGWETIFRMLESVCTSGSPPRSNSTDSMTLLSTPPSPILGRKHIALGLGGANEKSHSGLVKIAFQSLKLVCDSVSSLSPEHLRLCISTLGQFGRQADTNIALTAAASLLWSVSDSIQSKRKDADQEPQYSELWMFLLEEELGLCADRRPEVRDGAIQTLFRTMQLYGSTLSAETWNQCVWKITFPLLDCLNTEIRRLSGSGTEPVIEQAWDDSKILALQSVGSIFNDFLAENIMPLESFEKAWEAFVNHVQESVLLDNRNISAPALRCLEKGIKASASAEGETRDRISYILEKVWETIDSLGGAVVKRSSTQTPLSPGTDDSPHKPFTQESLVAFVDMIQSARSTSRLFEGKEWDLERLTRLMAILKGILTYPNSSDYRPDVDSLPPVQAVVMDTIIGIDLSIPGSPSLIMRDLSEYSTLPFLAAFDIHKGQGTTNRITYIALAKKTMPMLVDLFQQFKESLDIYMNGTLEAILSAYSIPVKLKYECPAPSKYGKDLPLWKTATTCFLRIIKDATVQMRTLSKDISDEQIESIWRQILDVFRGGILADCSAAESFSLEVQEIEENFDLALIASLEADVVPCLGDARVPDDLVSLLARILHQGSRIYEQEENERLEVEVNINPSGGGRRASSFGNGKKVQNVEHMPDFGSTNFGLLVPRERFSYWCFDLLFLICADNGGNGDDSRKRLAALSLSSLLNRCRTALVGFVADEALRGNLPFPRLVLAREEELLYILRKALALRLWPGSLWAALSDDPSKYCITQPDIDTGNLKTPSALIADAVKRSSIGHLFHFYPVLCEIASIPRRTPSVRVIPNAQGIKVNGKDQFHGVSEIDSRTLARECLLQVGKEMGVAR